MPKKPLTGIRVMFCEADWHGIFEDLDSGYVRPLIRNVRYEDDSEGKYRMLKPHSLVLRVPDKAVLYSPRFYHDRLAKKWQQFLENHPDWPDRLIATIPTSPKGDMQTPAPAATGPVRGGDGRTIG